MTALTLQEVQLLAPSAFATEKHVSRSARYTFVSTVDIIKAMEDRGFGIFKASQSGSRREDMTAFAKHMLRFRPFDTVARVGDTVPEVVLVNAHNGSSIYKLLAGLFRFVCANGMVVSQQSFGAITVRHQGNVIEQIVSGSQRVIEASSRAVRNIAEWQRMMLNRDEQMAYAESARVLRFADSEGKVSTPVTAEQLLEPRRREDTGNDLYTTFQRVQENTVRGGIHATELVDGERRNLTTRAIRGIDQDIRLNTALWQLTEAMANLKK
jgi:Domain of unknown function (DUF932)